MQPGASGLHPDLARLEAEYDRVLDSFEASHVTIEQARATISAMSVVDADGAVWGLDEDGGFVRSRIPGTPPVVTNPSLFAAARTPEPVGPQQMPWQTAGVESPRMVGPNGLPIGVSIPTPERQPRQPRQPRDKKPGRAPREPREPRKQRETGRMADTADRVRDLVRNNRTTAIVLALVLAVILGTLLLTGRNDDPVTGPDSTGVTTTLPLGDPNATTIPTVPAETTLPVVTEAPTTLAAPLPQFPSDERVEQVYVALISGEPDTVVQAVIDSVSQGQVALNAAFWTGLKTINLEVVTDPAASDGAGTAVQIWRIKAGGQEFATATVHWKLTDTGWLMTTWPTISDSTLPPPTTVPETTTTAAPETTVPPETTVAPPVETAAPVVEAPVEPAPTDTTILSG